MQGASCRSRAATTRRSCAGRRSAPGWTLPSRAGRTCRPRPAPRPARRSSGAPRFARASVTARRASRATSPRPTRSTPSGRAPRCARPAASWPRTSGGLADLVEELEDELGELVWAFHRGSVRRARDPRSTRARNLTLQPRGDRVHVRHVELTDQHQGRNRDLAEALADVRHERFLLGGLASLCVELKSPPLHLPDLLPNGRLDLIGGAVRTVDPRAQVDLDRCGEVTAHERRLLFFPGALDVFGPLVPTDPRADEDEGPDQVGSRDRDLKRSAAAERNADERRGAELELVEQRDQVARV